MCTNNTLFLYMFLPFPSRLLTFLLCLNLLFKIVSELILWKIQLKASVNRQPNFMLKSYGNTLLYIAVRYMLFATYDISMLIYVYIVSEMINKNKTNAHLRTNTKTPAKFPKDTVKIRGGYAFTRYPVPMLR